MASKEAHIDSDDTPARIIARLGLAPHPEGGWYRQTWRAEAAGETRPGGTAIHFLLEAHQRSHWHRVDASEIWMWHAGATVELSLASADDGPVTIHSLGADVLAGEEPQVLVPTQYWQAARPLAGWALVSCVVVPGFSFDGFELAAPKWRPGFKG